VGSFGILADADPPEPHLPTSTTTDRAPAV
jgi:hypothetical protein